MAGSARCSARWLDCAAIWPRYRAAWIGSKAAWVGWKIASISPTPDVAGLPAHRHSLRWPVLLTMDLPDMVIMRSVLFPCHRSHADPLLCLFQCMLNPIADLARKLLQPVDA